MSVFKCKMCGASLEISEDMKVCECEYCGTAQTVHSQKDENIQALFNRANILRMKSEFDKAEQLYEKIIQNAPDEPEAHWGLILCKFGIEYVEDPVTFKRIPTCHRTSFDSIIADDDYKEALRCADSVQRDIYEREAKEIDRLQKEILALSAKEEPYDVFICYKESDNGSHTPDSVIANDIYYQLTNEGFKVFYAAISLENKLGSAYEPCIFAALNSAKVMLAIGTNPDYFNAVWVKNEWSRFLKMMKKDRSKLLIPCYKDMDAYELPEEFAHLQAQDMSKIGFINDLVRGIKKVIVKDEPKPAAPSAVHVSTVNVNANVKNLIRRVFIFLEDGDWSSADEYCEKVLDLAPENGEAYLGKLMTELRVRKREELKDQAQPFDESSNYKKIIRYGDDDLIAEMRDCNEFIKNRNLLEYQESTYQEAAAVFNNTRSTKDELTKAKTLFESISGYKDADKYISEYDNMIKEKDYQNALFYFRNIENSEKKHIEAGKNDKEEVTYAYAMYGVKVAFVHTDYFAEKYITDARNRFERISDYKDSAEYIRKCDEKLDYLNNEKKLKIYDSASTELSKAKDAYSEAASPEQYEDAMGFFEDANVLFQKVADVKDSAERIRECESLRAECKEKKRECEIAQRAAEQAAEAATKRKKIIIAVVSAAVVIAVAAAICLVKFVIIPETNYNNAVALLEQGKYEEAITAFEAMNGYKDSATQIEYCQTAIKDIDYDKAVSLMNEGKYNEAITAFEAMNGYKDSAAQIEYCQNAIKDIDYDKAVSLMNEGKYNEAINAFEALDGYKKSTTQIENCQTAIKDKDYNNAVSLMNSGKHNEAIIAFEAINGYKDSDSKVKEIYKQHKAEILRSAKVGDHVVFGSYEQDNNTSNGKEDVEWLVLAKEVNKALVISCYAIDCQPYDTSYYTDVTWETCSLRKWLNGIFVGIAFSTDERNMIQTTTVTADKNPSYYTSPGNNTTDKIFLLSITEVNKYFSSNNDRQCTKTDYCYAKNPFHRRNGNCWWWLRSPGNDSDNAAYVDINGIVDDDGCSVDDSNNTVRPAMWIDIS